MGYRSTVIRKKINVHQAASYVIARKVQVVFVNKVIDRLSRKDKDVTEEKYEEVFNVSTLFEKITENKETLAQYLLKFCDNPICEANEDICDFCDIREKNETCCKQECLKVIIKGLDSDLN